MRLDPEPETAPEVSQGVNRWFCPDCGSPLAATFDYLPGQVYVPLGLLDQAADLAPDQHCHDAARLPWLHIDDSAPRETASGRDRLNRAAKAPETCG